MINKLDLLEKIIIESRNFFEHYSKLVPLHSDFSNFPERTIGVR